jgi:hypothetical protein
VGSSLSGCGSPPEPAKGPAPVQVEWSRAGSGEDTSGDTEAKPGEVDLDAPPAQKVAPRAAKKEPPPKEPEPPTEPAPPSEPSLEPTPPVAEAETESDDEAAAEAPAAEPPAPTPLGKEIRAAVKSKEKPSAAKKPPARKRATAAKETPASAYTGPNPCKATSFSVARVKEACEAGGRTAAKGVMKDAVGKALAAGASLKCGDCHAEQVNYGLKKDAVAQLKKWLGP